MRELLLIEIRGQRFAVGKETVADVRQVGAVHRLPLTPDWLAGIALVDGQTVTLADLAACLYGRKDMNGNGQALMLKEQGKIHGFVVSGSAGSYEARDDAFMPVPERLLAGTVSSCVLVDGETVPVLELAWISHQLLETAPVKKAGLSRPTRSVWQEGSAIRVFSIGEWTYAVPASEAAGPSRRPGRIAKLPDLPPFVRGIVSQDDAVLPVVDLSPALVASAETDPGLAITVGSGTDRFALLVDQDHGLVSADDLVFTDLPSLAQSNGIGQAVLRSGLIVPLLDLPVLLAGAADAPASPSFSPGSACPSLFLKEGMDVTEFSLLGLRHAVPKCEVEDVVPFRPYRPVPNTIPIVMGVSSYQQELLPVIDLGLIFGRRSPATQDWSLIVLKNGDFRALLLTDTVFGEAHLPLEVQRELPIILPYPVIYGCYPMHTGVRLILNVMELVLHFQKAEMQDILPTIVPRSEEVPETRGQFREAARMEPLVPAAPANTPEAVASIEPETGGSPEQTMASAAVVRPVQEEQQADVQEATVHVQGTASEEVPAEAGSTEVTMEPAAAVMEETLRSEDDRAQGGGGGQVSVDQAPQTVPQQQAAASNAASEKEAARCFEPEPEQKRKPAPAAGNRTWSYGAAAIVAVVLLFLLFVKVNKPEAPAPAAFPEKQKAAEEVKPQPAPKRPTLELEIPRSMPISIDTYIVVQGDTLWSISQRFTGNPYNYPKIAGENRIADPDLIFPGQRIKLIRK